MIKKLELECDYIKEVETRYHDNQIKVTLENVDPIYIARLDTKDVNEILDTIGVEDVEKWMDERVKE